MNKIIGTFKADGLKIKDTDKKEVVKNNKPKIK